MIRKVIKGVNDVKNFATYSIIKGRNDQSKDKILNLNNCNVLNIFIINIIYGIHHTIVNNTSQCYKLNINNSF